MIWPDERREVQQMHEAVLSRLRKARLLSQAGEREVAQRLSMTQSSLSKLLTGSAELTEEKLATLCVAYGIPETEQPRLFDDLRRVRDYVARKRTVLHRPGSRALRQYWRMARRHGRAQMVIVGEVPELDAPTPWKRYRVVVPFGVPRATEANRAAILKLVDRPDVFVRAIPEEAEAEFPPATYAVYGEELVLTDVFAGVVAMIGPKDVQDHLDRFTALWDVATPFERRWVSDGRPGSDPLP